MTLKQTLTVESYHQVVIDIANRVKRKQRKKTLSQLDVVILTFSYKKPQRFYVICAYSPARQLLVFISPTVCR